MDLPSHITPNTHPLVIRMMRGYYIHSTPQYDGLLDYQTEGHLTLTDICDSIGVDKNKHQ